MIKKHLNFVRFLLVGLLLALAVAYYLLNNNILGPTQKVIVSPKWVNQAQFAGIFSAKEENIYRKYGLKVEVKEFDFEANQFEDLMSGETDFALLSAEEVLLLANKDEPIKAVAAVYQVSPYVIISLANKDIKTPANFVNKKLGNKGGKLEGELVYNLLLDSVGLNENNASIVNLDFEYSEYDDLINGTVDAIQIYRTDQLYFFDKKALDYNIIYPENFGTNTFNDIIVARKDFIEKNPEIVRSFVSATVEGWEYAVKNPEESVAHTMKHVTNESYNNYDYELFILEQSIPLIKPDSDTSIGSMTLDQWNKLYKRMLERDFITKDINIKEVFTTEFLP